MTIQHNPQTSAVGMHRWILPAGLAAIAATLVIGATQYLPGTDSHVTARPVSVSDAGDLTRSQVLVQDAIDAALVANRSSDLTRSQVLVQDAIDAALASS